MILISLIVLVHLVATFDLQLKVRDNSYQIINANQLQSNFNQSTYNSFLNCQNGYLEIIEFLSTQSTQLIFQYHNFDNGSSMTKQDIKIQAEPNTQPQPTAYIIQNGVNGTFGVDRNCPPKEQITTSNYFNKITMHLGSYTWSYLINCDKGQRHKKFQFGYLLLMVLNAVITISVARNSKIWSLRYGRTPLTIWLSWQRFLAILFIVIVVSVAFFYLGHDSFEEANLALKYLGLTIAIPFVYICMNEIFFLFRPLKMEIYKFIRKCDIISIFITIGLMLLGFLIDFWLINDILAICICVGSIKLFNFKTMKQSIISMAIEVVVVTGIAISLHYILDQISYNDYASQLSSPLFFLIPDFISSLYKKCSWLCIFDITVPGVLMAFLRSYDENYSTRYVYTIIGNIIFILSTILWVLLQYWYPYSVPFCLVTYPCFVIVIVLLAVKRNELGTLWNGTFNRDESNIYVSDEQKTFSDIIKQQFLNEEKIRQSSFSDQSSQSKKDQQNQQNKK